MRSIESIGIKWSDDGVFSVEAADEKIRRANLASKNYSIVKTAFGLSNPGSPTAKQLEYSNKWITEWKFSPDMLREAYERCVDTKGSMKFSYIDGILKRWNSEGIANLNDLAEFEAQKKAPAKKRKTSYDIEEIKKIDTLDFI
jgi:DnaD/phage-associated family protein